MSTFFLGCSYWVVLKLVSVLNFADGNKGDTQKELAESTENFVSPSVVHCNLTFAAGDFDSSCRMRVLLILCRGVKRLQLNSHVVEKAHEKGR